MVDMELSFDPMTIEHLGFMMYSHLPNAVAELVANAYDADATDVRVVLRDDGGQSVEVIDDGHGMSDEDLAEKCLRIGPQPSHGGRRCVRVRTASRRGPQGLGKLALFRTGDHVSVRTKRLYAHEWTSVSMNWHDLKASTGGKYHPSPPSTPQGLPPQQPRQPEP